MNLAEYFTNWTESRLDRLQVMPPYERDDRKSQWVRGSIRSRGNDGILRDLVVTGPKMRITYGGCKWNRIVFTMNGQEDPHVYEFERWVDSVQDKLNKKVCLEPAKYKPGAVNASRFSFDSAVKPSSDPSMYPDELRCRLSTRPSTSADEDDAIDSEFVDPFRDPINPADITPGSYMIPIVKISYNRNIEKFGLVLTILKGIVFMADKQIYKIENKDWEIDYPMEYISS